RAKLAPHVPQKSLWIGGIGELHPNKNWSAAIIAMSTLSPKNHLLIIGEGEEKLKLEELIAQHNLSEQVHLLGYINAAQYLKAFDIFILPSKKEGLPYVLLEAGLAGVATIASDLPGNHDIIESGQSGLLVKPTPQLISTSLEILLRDEGMRRNLGSNLKQNTETNFSLEKMCQQTFDLYQSRTLSD
ncbi:glycosyltransferase, partial [Candidatus Kaiserbacteria bacterium]|nr:glycosyltransferase [Candidatus Kaiserbacteria bacterium]